MTWAVVQFLVVFAIVSGSILVTLLGDTTIQTYLQRGVFIVCFLGFLVSVNLLIIALRQGVRP